MKMKLSSPAPSGAKVRHCQNFFWAVISIAVLATISLAGAPGETPHPDSGVSTNFPSSTIKKAQLDVNGPPVSCFFDNNLPESQRASIWSPDASEGALQPNIGTPKNISISMFIKSQPVADVLIDPGVFNNNLQETPTATSDRSAAGLDNVGNGDNLQAINSDE